MNRVDLGGKDNTTELCIWGYVLSGIEAESDARIEAEVLWEDLRFQWMIGLAEAVL